MKTDQAHALGLPPVKGEEVTGCPVMHQDFSTTRNLGDYWALANDLRESCPHFYNKYSGGGYWVFTRHEAVKDIYKTPEIFSSESITPWEPNPIYRFVPTQVDAPDHIKYRRILNPWFSPKAMEAAAPMMRVSEENGPSDWRLSVLSVPIALTASHIRTTTGSVEAIGVIPSEMMSSSSCCPE